MTFFILSCKFLRVIATVYLLPPPGVDVPTSTASASASSYGSPSKYYGSLALFCSSFFIPFKALYLSNRYPLNFAIIFSLRPSSSLIFSSKANLRAPFYLFMCLSKFCTSIFSLSIVGWSFSICLSLFSGLVAPIPS